MKEFIEKLIGRLEEKKDSVPVNRLLDNIIKDKPKELGQIMAYDNAIEIVNQIAEEYNNGWIPVDKTLPKKSGYYTVTEEQYSLDMRKKMGVRVSHEVQFDAEEQRWYRAKFLKVIAWKEHETHYQPKGE